MKFAKVLEMINQELDKTEDTIETKPELSSAKESTEIEPKDTPEDLDCLKLAEQAILVRHLKGKSELTEKEKQFIVQVESIELTDEAREQVKKEVFNMLGEHMRKDLVEEKDGSGKVERIEGVIPKKDADSFNNGIAGIVAALMTDGFNNKDISDYLKDKLDKSLKTLLK